MNKLWWIGCRFHMRSIKLNREKTWQIAGYSSNLSKFSTVKCLCYMVCLYIHCIIMLLLCYYLCIIMFYKHNDTTTIKLHVHIAMYINDAPSCILDVTVTNLFLSLHSWVLNKVKLQHYLCNLYLYLDVLHFDRIHHIYICSTEKQTSIS